MDDKGSLYTIPLGFKQHPLEDAGRYFEIFLAIKAQIFCFRWIFHLKIHGEICHGFFLTFPLPSLKHMGFSMVKMLNSPPVL